MAESGPTPLATAAITITACGQVVSTALGVQPEHADIMLCEIDRLRAMLLKAASPPSNTLGQVIAFPIRR